jgi:hypothetical protein
MSGVQTPLQAYIILARDIDAFCCTVNVSAGSANAPCVHVSAQSKTAIKLEDMHTQGSAKAGKPIQLKCDFRGTKYPSMSALPQQKIVRSLASIISPSQRVVFTGNISDIAQIEDTKRIMSPTLVYPTAIWWSALGNLIMVKDVADASIEHDDLRFVILQYAHLELSIDEVIRTHDQATLEPAMVDALRTFRLEVTTNLLIGKLKQGLLRDFIDGFDNFCWFVEETAELLGDSWKMPDQLQAYIDNLRLWFDLYRPAASIIPGKKIVKDVVNALTQGEPGPHQAHDAQVLKRHTDQDDIIAPRHLPLSECSAVHLPFPGTSFYKNIVSMKERTRCRGWLDMQLVRALTEDQKQSIIDLQKRHGMEVTNFDRL